MSDGMCKTGTGGKGKGDRAPSEMVITRPYADVDSSYTIQDDINTYDITTRPPASPARSIRRRRGGWTIRATRAI